MRDEGVSPSFPFSLFPSPSGCRGPKRSESITAKGRAPMVKMSRRMPPTPVAAPWYGSI